MPVLFVGDFEQGIEPWTFAINGNQVQVVDFDGDRAGYVHLTPGGGRSRQELAHEPGARTHEGLETYYAWSFYFPEPLANCRQDIGYWEQRGVSRRTINVAVVGDQLHMETVFATGTDFRSQFSTSVTARQWHRITWHVKWSQDPSVGFVEGWYDGKPAVPHTLHRTLLADTDIFAHVGFLRNDDGAACNYAVQDMYVDNGMEATSFEEVKPWLDVPEQPPEPTASAGVGGSAAGAAAAAGGGGAGAASGGVAGAMPAGAGAGGVESTLVTPQPEPQPQGQAGSVTGATDAAPSEPGCTVAAGQRGRGLLLGLVLALGLWRRTRR